MTIEELRILREKEDYTCIIYSESTCLLASYEKGVMPIYHFIKTNEKANGQLLMADKIIGKAAAFLAIFAGVKTLHTRFISEGAKAILDKYEIDYTYEVEVPYIHNKMKTGQCPMESILDGVEDVAYAWELLDSFIINREKRGIR